MLFSRFMVVVLAAMGLYGCVVSENQRLVSATTAVGERCKRMFPPSKDPTQIRQGLECQRDGMAAIPGIAMSDASYPAALRSYSELISLWRQVEAGTLSYEEADRRHDLIIAYGVEAGTRATEERNQARSAAYGAAAGSLMAPQPRSSGASTVTCQQMGAFTHCSRF